MSRILRAFHHNWSTLCRQPFGEMAGSLGDLGTLLPLMVALTLADCISLPATLVFSGVYNFFSGLLFGIPIVVQPMKAIAAVALARHLTKEETMAAGIGTSVVVLLLSFTGLIGRANALIPVPIIKGIQLGAGFSLVLNAGGMLTGLDVNDGPWHDNVFWAMGAFIVLYGTCRWPQFPYAILVFTLGLLFAGIQLATEPGGAERLPRIEYRRPLNATVPTPAEFAKGFGTAGMGQVPLTVLNSVIAVSALSAELIHDMPAPSVTAIGVSVGCMNLVGCWFGAMPVCHGSGGLAGQFRFGARSGASVMMLGAFKVAVGLFLGDSLLGILEKFPKAILGIMVFAAGMELIKVGENVNSTAADISLPTACSPLKKALPDKIKDDRWMIMMVTAGMFLAFHNAFVGFVAGAVAWALLEAQTRMEVWGTGVRGVNRDYEDRDGLNRRYSSHRDLSERAPLLASR